MMTIAISRSLCISALIFAANYASARHVHRRPAHQHQKRATPVMVYEEASPVVEVTRPSITAGDDAIKDITDIQEGLSDLPGDLMNFIQAVEARLGEVESMLSNLMGSSAEALTVSTSSIRSPPTPFPQPSVNASATTTSKSSTIVSPIFFAGSSSFPASTSSTSSDVPDMVTTLPVPTSFRTSRITSTRVRTVTVQPTATGLLWPAYNGTGNYTLSYAPSGTLTPLPIRTFTVVPTPATGIVTSAISTSSMGT